MKKEEDKKRQAVTFDGVVRPTDMVFRTAVWALLCTAGRAADLWTGIPPGPHAVGFRFERRIDPTRTVDSARRGTPLGLAVWYPAQAGGGGGLPMTQLDYRLLEFSRDLDGSSREAFLAREAEVMVGWEHVGIVPLQPGQAHAAILAAGRAVRGAPPAAGRFPVTLVTSQAYLSTTAEILASHGRIVVAPVRFSDLSNEVPSPNFIGYVETSIRDMEWALGEIARDPAADASQVSVIGHGGGGMQALLLTMRNRAIRAVANIDASIFTSRTNPHQLPFYDPGLVRVPYLYIARAATRNSSDQYSEFDGMRFSRRYEVILDDRVRHHDLSDFGRGVSAVLGVRGEPQELVLQTFADVQHMLVRFLGGEPTFAGWLGQTGYPVRVLDAVEPAPTTAAVIDTISDATPGVLREAYARDPQARLFTEQELQKVLLAARARPALAAQVSRFALGLHPKSIVLHKTAAEIAPEAAAAEIYRRCAALEVPPNDWQASAAHAVCRERAGR